MRRPPWSGDDEAMYRWCETLIARQIEQELHSPKSHDVHAQWMQWLGSDEPAIWSARNGDMTPLRKKYPQLAEFLHPPQDSRHRRYPPLPMKKAALDLVRRVRLLWSKYYKRQRRRRGDGITTEEIAARYLGISQRQMHYWTKNAS